jgi:hypothetical protein
VGGNARIGLSADGGLTFPSGDTVAGSGDEPPGLAVGPSATPGIETADLLVTNTAGDMVFVLTFGSNALGNYQVLVGGGMLLGGGGPVTDLTATTGPGGAVYAAWAVDLGGGLSEVRVNGDRDGSQGAVFAYAGQVTVVGNTGGPRFTGVEAAPEFGAPTSPQLSVIRDGAQAGRLVVTFTRNQGGTAASPLLDVESLVSDDFGVTFFANGALPVPVHPASANDQFNPAMTTDLTAADGRVYVTWYDARNDGANTRVERYAAASVDGITWGAPIRLSPPSDLSGAGSLDDYFWQQDVVAEGGCAWAAWTHEGTASLGDVRVTRFQAQP